MHTAQEELDRLVAAYRGTADRLADWLEHNVPRRLRRLHPAGAALAAPAYRQPHRAVSVLLLLTPGPAVLYIVARSVEQGRAAGLVSVLGIHLGTIVHITAAAVGLSALVVSSALAFAIVKYLGAAYLIWIGIRTFMAKDPDPEAPRVPADPLHRVFRDGFVVNLFNPKTAIFFLAFLPQFVDPARGALHWQILILGLTFMGLGIMSDGIFALVAGAAGDFLRRNRRFLRFQRWFAGTSFIGLGVTAALAARK